MRSGGGFSSRRGASVADISVETTGDAQAAADASRDPTKLVSRSMPITFIEPIEAADFGLKLNSDAIADAQAAGSAWGVVDVLGTAPQDLDGDGVTVAILDTGIDRDHPAFASVTGLVGQSFVGGAETAFHDKQGHGTHCAGTILGHDVESIRIGVARGVTDVLIGKVLDDDGFGTTTALVEALKWAHSKRASIISMSLGFDFPRMQSQLQARGFPSELATSLTLRAYRDNFRQFAALAELLMLDSDGSPGTVLVAAAGNESRRHLRRDFLIDASMPASAARGIVSVGATQKGANGKLDVAAFSNINPVLSAPGVSIVSAAVGGGVRTSNGTSMACPHVAGVAALWWQWMRENLGAVRAGDIVGRLTATARHDVFATEFAFSDFGTGAVRAPQL